MGDKVDNETLIESLVALNAQERQDIWLAVYRKLDLDKFSSEPGKPPKAARTKTQKMTPLEESAANRAALAVLMRTPR